MSEITWLYLIATDVAPLPPVKAVKVGITANPFGRVDDLQCGCPDQLYIARAFGFSSRARARSLEKHFHHWKRDHRIHREWFYLDVDEALESLRIHIEASLTDGTEDYLDRFLEILWADSEEELTDLSEFA